MKQVTVSKTKSGEFFISIQNEVEIPDPQPRTGRVGVDLGLRDFVTLSTGEKVQPPRYLRRAGPGSLSPLGAGSSLPYYRQVNTHR